MNEEQTCLEMPEIALGQSEFSSIELSSIFCIEIVVSERNEQSL